MTECPFSPQELRCVQKLADGMSAKLIAHEMGLTVHTVNFYLRESRRKAEAARETSLVAISFRNGWIQ